jgi:hypothetical protein
MALEQSKFSILRFNVQHSHPSQMSFSPIFDQLSFTFLFHGSACLVSSTTIT